ANPSGELVSGLAGEGNLGEPGEILGYHPAYVRTLRSRLARGMLMVERPRAVRLQVNAGRVKFLQERGAGVPEYLDLTPDLAWLLGLYCAEGSLGVHPDRPDSCVVVCS